MKRLNFNIQESQYDWLSDESERLGVSISEIIRRAIEHYIETGSVGDSVAGWETDDPEGPEGELSYEDEVLYRLAMLEGMMLNSFPEKRRQYIYEWASGYAHAQMGFPPPEGMFLDDE